MYTAATAVMVFEQHLCFVEWGNYEQQQQSIDECVKVKECSRLDGTYLLCGGGVTDLVVTTLLSCTVDVDRIDMVAGHHS